MHITDIIKRPVATEKARNLANENNEYVFIVDKRANKIQIREAVEKLFNVKVESVNTLNIKPKAKRFRMSIYKTSALKKAMVKLKDGERINQLFSTDIKIIQNSEVFSYSVDSVLLSRFPKLPNRGLIVDLCAGNGAVGLFASTRTQAQILAVEIQERLADMAQRSIELNDLAQQMQVIHDDLKNLGNYISGSKVDIILCNPPYFKVDEHSNLNGSEHYLLARHEVATNLEEICTIAQRVLKSNGRLAMVHRPDRFLDILETMKNHNLAPKRIQFVYPKQGREANMLLIEAIKDGSPDGLKILPPLFIHEQDGSYTPEIQEIYYGK